jgi:hypothetical protein
MEEEQIHQIDELAARLESSTQAIPKILGWLKILLLSIFVCGAWVAGIEFRQSQIEHNLEEMKKISDFNEIRLRGIETGAAATAAKLDAIKETVVRIDRKLNP